MPGVPTLPERAFLLPLFLDQTTSVRLTFSRARAWPRKVLSRFGEGGGVERERGGWRGLRDGGVRVSGGGTVCSCVSVSVSDPIRV